MIYKAINAFLHPFQVLFKRTYNDLYSFFLKSIILYTLDSQKNNVKNKNVKRVHFKTIVGIQILCCF